MIMHYLPTALWFILIPFVLHRNVQALKIYQRQGDLVEAAEQSGVATPGMTLITRNQLLRYRIRTAEGVYALVIGVWGAISLWHPTIVFNNFYTWTLLCYLYFGPAATGYLTHRDLKVTKQILEMDSQTED